ncbi:unnamed protein product [Bemisia tabaci]|uniref:Endonuclease-reverse transcriptase n=1 Tax=Bemisia tabaci TaxID=7038 RepID=A0A9P0A4H8_BEMTA|nr:unnamed protein product [Bemisia tabaci]
MYLGVKLTSGGKLDQAIRDRNLQGRKAIVMLNGIPRDKRISEDNKKRIYNSVVRPIMTYGSGVWQLKMRTQEMLKATEMDFWRRLAGISRRERIRNERVREVMGVEGTIS